MSDHGHDGRPRPEPRREGHPVPLAQLAAFERRIGYGFVDRQLLGQALAHRSWCAEHAGYESNERLEFLGDAVLGFATASELFSMFPEADEGNLSRSRASVVCASTLAEIAREIGLGEVLLLGKGEAATGGRDRASILSDAMEAVIGAVFLDADVREAVELVSRLVGSRLLLTGSPDHKSRLHQPVAQGSGSQVSYVISDEGPEHDKTFRAVVLVDDKPLGTGMGRSKKMAEQAAAREAWMHLEPRNGDDPVEEESDG